MVNTLLVLSALYNNTVGCEYLLSTDSISVNMTSTRQGSSATYYCADSSTSTDVYITHCNNDGNWEPNPFTTTDCDKRGKDGKL